MEGGLSCVAGGDRSRERSRLRDNRAVRLAAGLQVLRLRDFRLVYGAALVSLIGDGVVPVALAFAVLDLSGSATDLGVVLASRTVALLGSLLAGGVLADRLGRRRVMMTADLVRLAGQGAIGLLLVAGDATVAELAVSQALLGAASGFFGPASSGLLPAVAGSRLREANALLGITMGASNIVGPAIAAVLVAAASPGAALLIDAGSYALSALLLVRVAVGTSARTSPAQPRRFLRDLCDGFVEVRSRTWLWAGLLVFSLLNLVAAAFPVLGPLVGKERLGGAERGRRSWPPAPPAASWEASPCCDSRPDGHCSWGPSLARSPQFRRFCWAYQPRWPCW